MQKRNTQERRNAIVQWVNTHGHVQVDDLASRFATSEVTIRKDLAMLADEGKLLRQFGGAAPLPKASPEAPVLVTSNKQRIGVRAATLLENNQRVIIDSGSTTACLVPHLAIPSDLVVMTNSLPVANQLTSFANEPTVLMTGGTWDAQSQSFQGKMAETLLAAYSFDIAFLGAAGLDIERGTTTYNELTSLSQTMAQVAEKVVVMAESHKLSYRMPNLELMWSAISVLVTDEGMPQDTIKRIEEHGVEVLLATPNGD